LIRDVTCCGSFYFCHGGIATKYRCPDKQHFNVLTLRCDDAVNVRCFAMDYSPPVPVITIPAVGEGR
jgi:hypothetical protein